MVDINLVTGFQKRRLGKTDTVRYGETEEEKMVSKVAKW
jgi:hypothetical protein